MGSHWRFVLYNPLSLCGMPRLQHVADECWAHVVLCPGTRLRSPDNREYHKEQLRRGCLELHFGWNRGPCTNSSAGCTMIFSRQIKWKDISAVQAPVIIAGRGRMGGSAVDDSTGQCRWGTTPPLTESVVRRRAQETAFRMTLESLQKTLPKQSRETPPILGLDLNSGLGLKGASKQGEEPFVEAGHEMESLLRNTDRTSITTMYSESGPTYFSPQGTSHAESMCGTCGNYHIVEECRVHIHEGRCTKATLGATAQIGF